MKIDYPFLGNSKPAMKTKNVLTLYFADLTHDHIALANGMFPLGIGYVASALKAILK